MLVGSSAGRGAKVNRAHRQTNWVQPLGWEGAVFRSQLALTTSPSQWHRRGSGSYHLRTRFRLLAITHITPNPSGTQPEVTSVGGIYNIGVGGAVIPI